MAKYFISINSHHSTRAPKAVILPQVLLRLPHDHCDSAVLSHSLNSRWPCSLLVVFPYLRYKKTSEGLNNLFREFYFGLLAERFSFVLCHPVSLLRIQLSRCRCVRRFLIYAPPTLAKIIFNESPYIPVRIHPVNLRLSGGNFRPLRSCRIGSGH